MLGNTTVVPWGILNPKIYEFCFSKYKDISYLQSEPSEMSKTIGQLSQDFDICFDRFGLQSNFDLKYGQPLNPNLFLIDWKSQPPGIMSELYIAFRFLGIVDDRADKQALLKCLNLK